MNKLQIITAVESYIHRDDMRAMLSNAFEVVNTRIGRDLRDISNLIVSAITNFGTMPPDVIDLRDVFVGERALEYVTVEQMLNQREAAAGAVKVGKPSIYTISANQLFVFPETDEQIIIHYFCIPPLAVSDDDSNDVMARFPELYIYGLIVESFMVTQDGQLRDIALAQYEQTMAAINNAYESMAIGSSPRMRRVR